MENSLFLNLYNIIRYIPFLPFKAFFKIMFSNIFINQGLSI